tara:strand:- start:4513 stop:6477 length:1965 start_codon:yes stop_codon:yes gene_type:complete
VNKLSFQKNIIKILNLGLIILVFFTIFNITNTSSTNVERVEPCKYFLNPLSNFVNDVEINKSDIYVYPEISNLICLNKISTYENNGSELQIYTNSKILNYFIFLVMMLLFLLSSFLSNLQSYFFPSSYFLAIYFNFYYSINFFSINIFLFFIFLIIYTKNDKEKNLQEYTNNYNNKFFKFFFFILYLVLVIFTQFSTHHFETMDWDINSYLVTSMDISKGQLPFESHYENKPPLLFYIYYLMSLTSNQNLLVIKILNDLFLFGSVFVLHLLISKTSKNIITPLVGTTMFIVLMSKNWFHPGYSEIHALLFLSISLLFLYEGNRNLRIFLSGLFFALTTLTNLGTVIFIIPICIGILKNSDSFRKLIYFIGGFFIPHFIFLIIYTINGLYKNYILAMYTIPRNYPRGKKQILNEFGIFIEDISNYSFLIYLALLLVFVNLLFLFIKERKYEDYLSNYFVFVFVFSLLFYFLASMGYQHHLIFSLFFIAYLISYINDKKIIYIIGLLSFVSLFNLSENIEKSYQNIQNRSKLVQEYPIKKASQIYFNDEKISYDIFALDNYLILFYLDIPNKSYISHPSLYKEQFVLEPLARINLVSTNEVENMISKTPQFIVCSNLNEECLNLENYIEINTDELKGEILHYYQREKSFKLFKLRN